MHTVFRGFGSYKRSLLAALLATFGAGTFMVKDASRLSGYSPAIFRRIVDDGLVIPVSTTSPRRWRVTSGVALAAGVPECVIGADRAGEPPTHGSITRSYAHRARSVILMEAAVDQDAGA
ncbi:hypothetical protein DSECCO2_406170 [anaerobic digester metagenome]